MNPERGAQAWAALALVLALGAGSTCRRGPEHVVAPAPSAASPAQSGQPSLEIKNRQHDFGTVVQGAVVQHRFEISNAGSTRLDLEGTTAALGCEGLVEPRSLEPGATGHLNVKCHVEFYGPLRVTLAVRAATAVTLAEVELTGSVTPLLAFDTPLVSLSMPFAEERSVDVHMQGALSDEARLALKDAGDAGISVTPLPAEHGAPRGLRLRVQGMKVGVHAGSIVLTTNLRRPRELTLAYSCEVRGSLAVAPNAPYFDLRAPGALERQISVQSSQPGFKVRAVRVAEGPFSASFAPRDSVGDYTVTVSVQAARITDDARGSLGRLIIVSNDRAEPEKELPLFAFGAPNRAPVE